MPPLDQTRIASQLFAPYRRKISGEYRPYIVGEDMTDISIGGVDRENGHPKPGDMVGRDPKDHTDQWLVNQKYFSENFEPAS